MNTRQEGKKRNNKKSREKKNEPKTNGITFDDANDMKNKKTEIL